MYKAEVPEKLIRDKRLFEMFRNGKLPIVRVADPKEYIEFLWKKLNEEVEELKASRGTSRSAIASELADVAEVLLHLAEVMHMDLEAEVIKKRETYGGFGQSLIWGGTWEEVE